MKYLIVLMLLLLTGCHRYCPNHGGQVTSLGYGEIKVAPDMAQFTIDVSFTKPTMKEAADEAQRTVDEVLVACKKTISDSNDVKTTRISTNKEFEWVNNANVFKGYAASQSIEVTLRDLSKMEELTEGLLNIHISGINNLIYNRSDMDSLRSAANVLAMLDAKKNVGKMCQAVKLTCEELVSARTTSAPGESPMPFAVARMDMAAKAPSEGFSVKPGLMTFSATVEATYRTK